MLCPRILPVVLAAGVAFAAALLIPPVRATGQATRPAHIDADVDAPVRALLEKLASDDWAERHDAQARLAALAEAAEPTLRAAARDADDAEVRSRCDAALAQICENRLIGPTLVTLRSAGDGGDDALTPQAAFAELARQAKLTLDPKDVNLWSRPLTSLGSIELDRVPFWQAVEVLRAQCGLDIEPVGSRLAIVAVPEGQRRHEHQTSISGPFRVRPARLARAAAIDLAGGAVTAGEFTLTVMVQAEPKLIVSRASRMARLEAVEDENGVSLLSSDDLPVSPVNRIAIGDTVRPGNGWWSALARLDYPAAAGAAGKRLARVKGSTSCSLLVQSQTIEIPDALTVRNEVKDVAGSPITIRSCRRTGSAYEVQVSGPRTVAGVDAMRLFRSQAMEGARLLTPEGRELPLQSTRATIGDAGVDLTLRFGIASTPADAAVKFVWQVPVDVRTVEIPFEFTDLPLP